MLKLCALYCSLSCSLFVMSLTMPLHAETKVVAFAGSARCDSINKKLVKEAARLAQDMGATVKVLDLKDYPMPLYDGDLEDTQGIPLTAKQFKAALAPSQVIMIASPEYNGSYSPLLKNTIDWLSRGEESGTFKGKTFVIMSTSPSQYGGERGLAPLRALLETLGGNVLPNQIALPQGYQAFDESGRLKDEQWVNRLRQAIQPALLK